LIALTTLYPEAGASEVSVAKKSEKITYQALTGRNTLNVVAYALAGGWGARRQPALAGQTSNA